MVGARRFIERVWKLREKIHTGQDASTTTHERIIHKTIHKVQDDIEHLQFNTAISSLMILVNELEMSPTIARSEFEIILKLLAPFAPHVTEELWTGIGNSTSIHTSAWPVYDPHKAIDTEITIVVQVNGKVRGSFKTGVDTASDILEKTALDMPEIASWTSGKKILKIIVVPKRLINIVVQ